ncbi:hypothetical protein Tco_1526271, partial [Tanacetum coccineum]
MVYVDDIIFGSTNKELCTAFEKLMKDKFQMSSMGELTFFLGLQTDVKSASTPVDLEKPLVKDGDVDDVDVDVSLAYTDSHYAEATQDRKSTTGGYLLTKGFNDERISIDQQIEYLMLNASPLKYCLRGGHVKRGWDTKIPQSSGPPIKVGDEAVHKKLGDKMKRAATTAFSLEAEQDN